MTMALSELQKKKLNGWFDRLDADRNGHIEEADYRVVAGRLAEIQGFSQNSPRRKGLLDLYHNNWEALRAAADRDGDGRVSRDEFLGHWERLLTQRERFEALVPAIVDEIFSMSDHDGDGRMSEEEHAAGLRALEVSEADAKAVFQRLDLDHDGFLSRDEVQRHVVDFYFSSDPDAPGNWLVGPV
jgi:Ca2+-binding EF-hand superfamily protein